MTPEEYQTYRQAFHNTQGTTSKSSLYLKVMSLVICVIGIGGFVLHTFLINPLPAKAISKTFISYVAKEGYTFSYPAGWTVGAGTHSVDISDSGASEVKARWSVEQNLPQMMQNGEAEAAPLIADEQTTINGIPAFKSVKQVQDDTTGTTKTVLTYQLLKDDAIYRFNCETNSNSQELLKTCDQIAQSFSFVK